SFRGFQDPTPAFQTHQPNSYRRPAIEPNAPGETGKKWKVEFQPYLQNALIWRRPRTSLSATFISGFTASFSRPRTTPKVNAAARRFSTGALSAVSVASF